MNVMIIGFKYYLVTDFTEKKIFNKLKCSCYANRSFQEGLRKTVTMLDLVIQTADELSKGLITNKISN